MSGGWIVRGGWGHAREGWLVGRGFCRLAPSFPLTTAIHPTDHVHSRCRETAPLKLAALSAEETELMGAMQQRLDTLARRAASLGARALCLSLSGCVLGCCWTRPSRRRVCMRTHRFGLVSSLDNCAYLCMYMHTLTSRRRPAHDRRRTDLLPGGDRQHRHRPTGTSKQAHPPLSPLPAFLTLPLISSARAFQQRRHNIEYPCMYTTYQCYLKDATRRMRDDMDRARRHGYHFAAKLVRCVLFGPSTCPALYSYIHAAYSMLSLTTEAP